MLELVSMDDKFSDEKREKYFSDEFEKFKKSSILSKEKLLLIIDKTISLYQHEAKSQSSKHTPVYYKTLDRMLHEFIEKVNELVLPEPLYDWWFYSFEITDMGIGLFLNVATWKDAFNIKYYECKLAQHYKLEEVKSNLLTVNDYAQRHGIQPVTVRQWIRRGKIRSAIKYGSEWRIPELFELSDVRGYVPAEYIWTLPLNDIPEKYAFLNDCKSVGFKQYRRDKTKFCIQLTKENKTSGSYFFTEKEFTEIFKSYPDFNYEPFATLSEDTEEMIGYAIMPRENREELEMYMISNPLVSYSPVEHCDNQVLKVGFGYTGFNRPHIF